MSGNQATEVLVTGSLFGAGMKGEGSELNLEHIL